MDRVLTLGKEEASTPPAKGWKEVFFITLMVWLLFLLLYSFHRGGKLEEENSLTLIFNPIALTAVVLISVSLALDPLARYWPRFWDPWRNLGKPFGLLSFIFAVFHSFSALLVLTPGHHPEMFTAKGELTSTGEMALLLGSLSLVLLGPLAVTSILKVSPRVSSRSGVLVERLSPLALLLVTLHFVIWQGREWLPPWPYGLPPGSLVACIFVVAALSFRLLASLAARKE